MTTFARPALPRPRSGRNATKLLIGLLAAALTCLAYATLAPPAHAIVETVESETVGVQPRVVGTLRDAPFEAVVNEKTEEESVFFNAQPETFEDAGGNPVLHGSNVYVDYWDPTFHYHGDWKTLIDSFLENVNREENSGADVFAVDEQYTDKSNEPSYNRLTYKGSYSDTTPYPSEGCEDPRPLASDAFFKTGPITCLTDVQIREHLKFFIEQHHLPRGMNTIYYILTPPGVAVCLDNGGPKGHCSSFAETEESKKNSFCSYHADINPSGLESGEASTILYGVIPWSAGLWGDGQFKAQDQYTEAPYCQDGGFNPAHNEEFETKLQTKTPAGWKTWEKLGGKEKEEALQTIIDGAHQEEPNGHKCPPYTEDGFCDVGLADLIINQLATEQQDITTNPLLHSWHDVAGNEVTDECRNWFAVTLGGAVIPTLEDGAGTLFNQEIGDGRYYLGESFNLASDKLNYPGIFCTPGIKLIPEFNDVSPVGVNETVGFDGGESSITLDAGVHYSKTGEQEPTYAKMKWNFGDGSPEVTGYAPGSPTCEPPWSTECAESVYHAYAYGGTYNVTLTVTDVGGNTNTVSHQVTVIGPPPEKQTPPPPTPETGGGGSSQKVVGGSTTGGGTTGGGTTASGASVPVPVATAAVVSHSLKGALSKGVAVHYQVNEQVAGHFEVLLGQKMAKRLKIHGSLASNLPVGAEPEVVIGTALVVTLKGGGSTTHIVLTKSAAKALSHVKKVPLDLRLTVRNAAIHNPATAVVVSPFTLKR